jgi:rubrerythrin
MRGDPKVVEYLNKALRHELTAVNQYWLHYRLLDNWGYKTLAKIWRKESIEEMQHADKIIERGVNLIRAHFPCARARRNRATRSEIRPTRSSRLGGASPISF